MSELLACFASFVCLALVLLGASALDLAALRLRFRAELDEILGRRAGQDRWVYSLAERQVELRVHWHHDKLQLLTLEVGIEVPHAGPDFTIARATASRQLGRFVGLVNDRGLGNRRLDDRFVCSGDPRSLRQLFAETDLEALMHRGGTTCCELREGVLWTTTRLPRGTTAMDLAVFVHTHLLPVSRNCERAEVEVRVRELERVSKHFVWLGKSEHARCPYCLDQLDLSEPNLAACPRCDTVHHGECLDEHGGCTVLGCTGRVG